MAAIKEYQAQILPIINDLRASGLSDAHILQIFELALDGHPGKPAKKNDEDKLIASITLDIYENREDINIKGDTNAIRHGSAALAIAYKHYHELSFGETIADVITEMEAIEEAGVRLEEES